MRDEKQFVCLLAEYQHAREDDDDNRYSGY